MYLSHRRVNEILVKSKARISYSERGAKGKVHMESFIGKFKVENSLIFWELDGIKE